MTSTPDEIIRETERRFPMPQGEIARLEDRRWVLNLLPKGGIGAEIGVFRGHFSALICEVAAPRKLYLVDPWTTLGETFGWGKDYTNFDTLTTEAARDEALARVARHPATSPVVIESRYPACADRIAEPLDWAYLDSNHERKGTLKALRALERQIGPGGMILGDDWDARAGSQHHGVYLAVNDFLAGDGWELVSAGRGRQWAIRRAA